MRISVVLEQRFRRPPDGTVWTQTMCGHDFWMQFREVFDSVNVIARVEDVSEPPQGWRRADGAGVAFTGVPYYVGPIGYLRRAREIAQVVRGAVGRDDAVLMRVPSPIAARLDAMLRRERRPYGVQVVGDPHDVFAPGAVRHPLRPVLRGYLTRQLRRQCRGACCAAYVTQSVLQVRYPAGPGAFMCGFSDVELPRSAFKHVRRPALHGGRRCNLLLVGSLEQMYKGADVAIDAVRLLVDAGVDAGLVVVGDGRHRAELEARAVARGVDNRVGFRGQLPGGDAVRAEMDKADLFLIPSRTEGLPRALIEAMARGAVCLGSRVGGIPELLPPEFLVPPGDAEALAKRVAQVVASPGSEVAAASRRNFETAQGYAEEVIRERRLSFFHRLRDDTREWLGRRGGSRPVGSAAIGMDTPASTVAAK